VTTRPTTPERRRTASYTSGSGFFRLLRPLPRSVAFALTGIALFVVALTLGVVMLPLNLARCPLTLAIVALTLVLALPLYRN
jgi:hypothetical protein